MSAATYNYSHEWLCEHRGGYGYVTAVPCRLLGSTATGKRMRIAALRADGSEVVRYVKIEKLRARAAVRVGQGEGTE